MNKTGLITSVAVAGLLIIAAFFGGTALASKMPWSDSAASVSTRGPGGAMASVSEEERAKLDGMSDEERQAYMQEKFGAEAPAGGRGMRGGGLVEGTVLDASAESVTVQTEAGGSQAVYLDEDTVMAYGKGVAAADLKKGDSVIAVTEPEADGVVSAKAIIVR